MLFKLLLITTTWIDYGLRTTAGQPASKGMHTHGLSMVLSLIRNKYPRIKSWASLRGYLFRIRSTRPCVKCLRIAQPPLVQVRMKRRIRDGGCQVSNVKLPLDVGCLLVALPVVRFQRFVRRLCVLSLRHVIRGSILFYSFCVCLSCQTWDLYLCIFRLGSA